MADCPLCQTFDQRKISKLHSVGFIDRMKCDVCGLQFFSHSGYTKPRYDLKYNKHFFRPGDIRKAGIMAEKIAETAEEKLHWGRYLEFGAGNGLTAKLLEYMGVRVKVLEIDPTTGKFFKENLGLELITADITSLNFNGGFDIIYSGHTIEHIAEPKKLWESISRIINDNGYFIFDTPAGEYGEIEGVDWKHYQTRDMHEHCSIYCAQAIEWVAEKYGWEIVRLDISNEFKSLDVALKKRNQKPEEK